MESKPMFFRGSYVCFGDQGAPNLIKRNQTLRCTPWNTNLLVQMNCSIIQYWDVHGYRL